MLQRAKEAIKLRRVSVIITCTSFQSDADDADDDTDARSTTAAAAVNSGEQRVRWWWAKSGWWTTGETHYVLPFLIVL